MDSNHSERGRARVVAAAVTVTTVLIAGSAYQHIQTHQREVAEEATLQRHRATWDTPNYGYPLELANTAADEKGEIAEAQRRREEFEKELMPVVSRVRLKPSYDPDYPLGRPTDSAMEEMVKREAREAARVRREALAKRKREMDRAYAEYLAGFPECEAYVDGAMLNDLCGPRPLSRKDWERRERPREQAEPIANDPLIGLDSL